MKGHRPGYGIGSRLRSTLSRSAILGIALPLAALLASGPAPAQTASPAPSASAPAPQHGLQTATKSGAWETRCESPPGAASRQCAVVQSILDDERPNITLVAIALKTADRKSRLLRVIAPLGVLLPTGLGLRIDGDDFGRMSFVRCMANGCVAEVFLEDKLLDKMRTGKTITFYLFETPEEGIGVPAPLNGFKEAFDALP